jgi:glycosyltransferase involved in cell wall biosynthesis
MATANQALLERFDLLGWSVVKLNTSSATLNRSMFSRLTRIWVVLRTWLKLIKNAQAHSVLYLALSGGWGQIYDVVTISLGRLLGLRRVIHHHSTAYLFSKNWITWLLCNIAGKDSVHIVLCDMMRQQLVEKYRCQRIIVLSNLALFPANVPVTTKEKVQTIGFLSNITSEKGGWEVIELARAIHSKNRALRMVVAGPCQEQELANALQMAEQEGALQWRGALYGAEKQHFCNEVDVFIFPTNYKNEAEPLVVWEALSAGVPVIAYDRGCIRCQIGEAGKIIPREHDLVVDALGILKTWVDNPAEYQRYAIATQAQYKAMHDASKIQWQQYLDMLRKELQRSP